MSDAREAILRRIRSALGDGNAPTQTGDRQEIGREYRRTDGRAQDTLVELFCERVGDYRAEVQRIASAALEDALTAAALRSGGRRLVVPPGLPAEWRPAQLELVPDAELTTAELDELDGVITGCTVAIAETGTIVLTSDAHEGRRALSLVPDLHICIVQASQIVGTVPEALAQLAPVVSAERRPLTFISGPSATSDIELKRVEGVHGPRKLVVFVTEESP